MLIAGIAILLAVGLMIYLLTRQPAGLMISQKIGVDKSFAAAVPFKLHTLVYSDGQSLIEYNYKTGASKAISPDTGPKGLQFVDSMMVSEDTTYILFRQIATVSGSKLAEALQQAGLGIAGEHWWLYNIKTKQYQPIPLGSVRTAKLDGKRLYVQLYDDNRDQIVTYDLATLKQLSSIDVLPSETFFVIKDGFLLQTNDRKVYFTKDGVVNEQWFDALTIAGVTADKTTAIGLDNSGGASNLVTINLQDRSARTIMHDLVNMPTWHLPGTALFITGSTSSKKVYRLFTYSVAQNKIVSWKVADAALPADKTSSYIPQVLLDDSTAVLSDTLGNYYMLGNSLFLDHK